MELTTKQVAAKLGFPVHRVRTLATSGELPPLNQPAPGKRKRFYFFDSRAVADYQRRQALRAANGEPSLPLPAPDAAPAGVISRLDRLEKKLDRLLALWE
jgi:hypothetical protein